MLQENAAVLAVMLCILFLYPLPLVLFIDNISRWDNYCKFNFVGVLSAWILLAVFWTRHCSKWHWLLSRLWVIVLVLVIACHESFILTGEFLRWNARAAHNRAKASTSQLIKTIKEQVPINSRILLVNRDLTEYYRVSDHGRMLVNLYRFLGKYYGEFIVPAEETGAAVVNFELMNGANVPGPRRALLEVLDRAHKGTLSAAELRRVRIEYVLCAADKAPAFLVDWQKEGRLQLLASDEIENWSLWRCNSIGPVIGVAGSQGG